MSSRNRDFKKLLATVCGVASAFGGGAVSAKGNNLPTNKGSVKSAVPANGSAGLVGFMRQHPIASGATAGGGIALTTVLIYGFAHMLSGDKKKDDKLHDKQDEQDKQDKQDKQDDQKNMYLTPFDQVKIKNFEKRVFGKAGEDGNGLAETTANDIKRDGTFVNALKKAGISENALLAQNFAAFTSNDKDHSTTVYVVNAPAGSPIRQSFVSVAEKQNISMFYSDTDFPDLLFFICRKGSFGRTSWLVPDFCNWYDQGTVVFYMGKGNDASELS